MEHLVDSLTVSLHLLLLGYTDSNPGQKKTNFYVWLKFTCVKNNATVTNLTHDDPIISNQVVSKESDKIYCTSMLSGCKTNTMLCDVDVSLFFLISYSVS